MGTSLELMHWATAVDCSGGEDHSMSMGTASCDQTGTSAFDVAGYEYEILQTYYCFKVIITCNKNRIIFMLLVAVDFITCIIIIITMILNISIIKIIINIIRIILL